MLDISVVTLIAALLAFLASIIATVVSLYSISFLRFSREKWWEKKAEAYSRIIDALSEIVEYYSRMYDAELLGSPMPRKDIERDWGQKFREVVKAANMGAFYISEDAEDALRDYINRPDIANEYPGAVLDEFGQSYDYAKECLNKLVICAKKDLRVVKY